MGEVVPVLRLPSGKPLTTNYGKSPSLIGKSTISMAIFNSYVSLPEGIGGRLGRRYGGKSKGIKQRQLVIYGRNNMGLAPYFGPKES